MRRSIYIVLILLLSISFKTSAQSIAYTITITDPLFVPRVESHDGYVNLIFGNDEINAIAGNYTIYSFSQQFPTSNYEHLRQIYKVEASSMDFLYDLVAYNNAVFPGGDTFYTAVPEYTPNDYGYYYGGAQKELDAIHAKDAWDTTKGNPDLRVAINDTYFKTTHEDLAGKIRKTFYNGYVGTNNTKGISSIGFNTKIDIGSPLGDSTVLAMSRDSINIGHNPRVINASWVTLNCVLGYSPYYYAYQQDVYNEIYENGTVMVFAAGNGNMFGTQYMASCGQTGFAFPASFNHNISVTAVGHLNDSSSSPGVESIVGRHEQYMTGPSIPSVSTNHNNRVDICAPGI